MSVLTKTVCMAKKPCGQPPMVTTPPGKGKGKGGKGGATAPATPPGKGGKGKSK